MDRDLDRVRGRGNPFGSSDRMKRLQPWQTVLIVLGLAFLLAFLIVLSGIDGWGNP